MSAVLLEINVFSYVLKKHTVAALYDKHLDIRCDCLAVLDDFRNWLNEPVRPADVGHRNRSTSPLFYPSLAAGRRLCGARAHLAHLWNATEAQNQAPPQRQ
jgi:hypothetical protein